VNRHFFNRRRKTTAKLRKEKWRGDFHPPVCSQTKKEDKKETTSRKKGSGYIGAELPRKNLEN